MASAWMEFLADYRKKHPKLKGAEVMRAAGVEYRKKHGKKDGKKADAKKDPKKGKKEMMEMEK